MTPEVAEGQEDARAGPLRIAVMRGDGIGSEVIEQALHVLAVVGELYGVDYTLHEFPHGAEHYLATGELIDDDALERLGEHHALLFGAVGDPRVAPRTLERGLLFTITQRYRMDISVRPYRLVAERLSPLRPGGEPLDCVIVREAAEDVFVLPGSSLRRGFPDEVSLGTVVFTRPTVERVIRYGFELARARTLIDRRHDRGPRVTVVDQSNAAVVYDLWSRVLAEVAPEFSDVEHEHEAPDAFAMRFIKEPSRYDVVVTSWMLGGIFADMGAILVGGLGVSGSARLSERGLSLFEPTHGSAPKYAGKGVVSPLGAVEALRLLLEHNGHRQAAAAIDRAVEEVLVEGAVPDAGARSGVSTQQQGQLVAAALRATT
jgi:3-isopropylmalate dehydrogenase